MNPTTPAWLWMAESPSWRHGHVLKKTSCLREEGCTMRQRNERSIKGSRESGEEGQWVNGCGQKSMRRKVEWTKNAGINGGMELRMEEEVWRSWLWHFAFISILGAPAPINNTLQISRLERRRGLLEVCVCVCDFVRGAEYALYSICMFRVCVHI